MSDKGLPKLLLQIGPPIGGQNQELGQQGAGGVLPLGSDHTGRPLYPHLHEMQLGEMIDLPGDGTSTQASTAGQLADGPDSLLDQQ